MFFFLSKLLPLFVLPPGGSLTLLAVAAFWRRRAIWLILAATVWLYLPSTFSCMNWLGRSLESSYPPLAMSQIPESDGIVLLGGSLHIPSPTRPFVEFNESADRVWMAAKLYRAGKAPWIVISGSNLPLFGENGESEARSAFALLCEWGVPAAAMTMEERSYNTHENATFTKPLLAARGARRILLVTSAFHMQRAHAIFRREGMDVFPVATDYLTGWGTPEPVFRWAPNARHLQSSMIFLQEWFSLAVYRLRGWA